MSQARYLEIILVHNFSILVHIFLMWGLCLSVGNSPGGMLHKVSIITGNASPPLPPPLLSLQTFAVTTFTIEILYITRAAPDREN